MSKCGKCSRYLKFIVARPSRLYCPSCEEVLAVPQVGLAGSHLSLLWVPEGCVGPGLGSLKQVCGGQIHIAACLLLIMSPMCLPIKQVSPCW